MTNRRGFNINSNSNPFGSITSLIVMVGILLLLFFLVKGFITILYWLAIPLFIITLIINYRVVANYVTSLFDTFQTDILMGVVKVGFTILCYPIVIGWLFAKALVYRKVETLQKSFEEQTQKLEKEQFVDYEDITNKKQDDILKGIDKLEMPKPKEKDKSNPYDNIFEN
jgi:hypothetical protein